MAIFAKRHYEAIAKAMHNCEPDASDLERMQQWRVDIYALIDMFEGDNHRFNRKQFVLACASVTSLQLIDMVTSSREKR